jgi:large subunit ribosomal protein LP0
MSKGDGRHKKEEYFIKLKALLEEYNAIFIVNVDNVGSNQMHQIRQSLRGQGVVLMGKNTMVRRALKIMLSENPQFEKLMPHVKGNVGFVFTNNDLKEIRNKIVSNRVAAPAKAGAVAPDDVWIPGGNTGMEPGKTSFFQALGIPTKIARGTIEIVQDVHIVRAGTKVGASEAALLNMLGISPFTYGMTVIQVFSEGTAFPPSVLDIEEESLLTQFLSGIKTVAAISLAAHYPTRASVPHSLVNGYKDVLAVAVTIDYKFPLAEKVFAYLADPSAFQAVAATETSAPTTAAPVEEKKEEPAEESDDDMGFGLFD